MDLWVRQPLRFDLRRLQDAEADPEAQRAVVPRNRESKCDRVREAKMGTISAIIISPLGLGLAQIFLLAFGSIQPALAQSDPKVLEYKGTVAAAREAEVAPRLDALLTTINFSAGQVVKKGDLLFEFGSRSAELSLALAQAHLKQVGAQLRLAETNLNNKHTLRTRNVASEMEFLDAEAQRDIAAAKVDEARANVELGQITLQQMKLYKSEERRVGKERRDG